MGSNTGGRGGERRTIIDDVRQFDSRILELLEDIVVLGRLHFQTFMKLFKLIVKQTSFIISILSNEKKVNSED